MLWFYFIKKKKKKRLTQENIRLECKQIALQRGRGSLSVTSSTGAGRDLKALSKADSQRLAGVLGEVFRYWGKTL